MASSIIHIAVANEINKILKRDKSKMLIGSIAPDISKLLGEDKKKSHFLTEEGDIPNLDEFLKKYKSKLDDDFVMGYYIHLYTDYLWFKDFVPNIYRDNLIRKIDGSIIECTDNMLTMYIYNDYTNLNIKIIDKYNLDLKIFYNDIPKIDAIIQEIPMDKIDLIVNKAGEIVENSKEKKNLIFDTKEVEKFINCSVKLILKDIMK